MQTHTIRFRGNVEEVWKLLTSTESLQRFYFDSIVESDMKPGASLRYVSPNRKRVFITGEVKEVAPPLRWRHTLKFTHVDEPASDVEFRLRQDGDEVEVTVEHSGFTGDKHFKMVQRGWPFILRNMKSWVEEGRLPLSTRVQYGMMKLIMPLMPKRRESSE
uniref:SRPBCC domain-containing protein n=1 Tax=Sandaracinus sp. TaxID=2024858 RepID=UPI0019D45175|nr:SRPBCC domain-containing protein [Sandaracinus sp.]